MFEIKLAFIGLFITCFNIQKRESNLCEQTSNQIVQIQEYLIRNFAFVIND